MSMASSLELRLGVVAQGSVNLPGSKSISNRVLLLSALATGSTRIDGLLQSDDTSVMLTALRELGVQISTHATDSVTVQGVARFPVERAELFMGNAGTAIRPLTAALAMMGGHYTLSGVPRMHERPIGDLVDGGLPQLSWAGRLSTPKNSTGRHAIGSGRCTRFRLESIFNCRVDGSAARCCAFRQGVGH